MQVTRETKFSEINKGDIMPDGSVVTHVDRKMTAFIGADGQGTETVQLTTTRWEKWVDGDLRDDPAFAGNYSETSGRFPEGFVGTRRSSRMYTTSSDPEGVRRDTTFAANWAHETYGQAVDRAEYMHSLPDNS